MNLQNYQSLIELIKGNKVINVPKYVILHKNVAKK